MVVALLCIILLLAIAVVALSIALVWILKKTTFIGKRDKDFLLFTIDMYIDYAKDLNINSETEHDNIVKELNRIKDKHLKE